MNVKYLSEKQIAVCTQGEGKMKGYVVLQVVLKEALIGTGSNRRSLSNLEAVINAQCAKGYRLHTITTASSGSVGLLGGDRIQATLVFEPLELSTSMTAVVKDNNYQQAPAPAQFNKTEPPKKTLADFVFPDEY